MDHISCTEEEHTNNSLPMNTTAVFSAVLIETDGIADLAMWDPPPTENPPPTETKH